MKSSDLNWYDLFGRRLTRRDFLQVGGGVAGLVSVGALSACRGDWTPRFRSTPFTFGVASGDPLPDGVVLWTRLTADVIRDAGAADRRVAVRWEVSEDDGFRRVVAGGTADALPELGHSVHVEVGGLEPHRDYWYRFMSGGEESVLGRTRTAPLPGAPLERMRFAFCSCQNYEVGYYTAYQYMVEEDLDLVVHLGDYIYEKRFGTDQVRQHEAGEVYTLDEYRARYTLYRSDAQLQTAHAAFPWITTTDDHEVDNNYADDAAEDEQTPAELLLRRAAAYQAYYEFLPLRRSSMPVGPDMRIFRRLGYGGLATFHVLDTRQYRSDQPCGDRTKPRCEEAYDPELTMMGAEQEAWLYAGLRASEARWNLLANQVMIAQLGREIDGVPRYSMDRWDGYVEAQKRFLTFLAEERPTNPVVITGDIHSNWACDLKADFDDPSSAVVGAELVGTSITSGGDGRPSPNGGARDNDRNPHIKMFNSQRGYVSVGVTPERLTGQYRIVPYVSRPGAPIETLATFVVENGHPGLERA